MKQIEWFDRKFSFDFEGNIFPSVIDRLRGCPIRLVDKMSKIPAGFHGLQADGKWSMKENIGHLLDVEPLWLGRLNDIMSNEKHLRAADLQNKMTDKANYNNQPLKSILDSFIGIRDKTLDTLSALQEEDMMKSALHPRLGTPMRIMDLFLFVAEHDDHHLARIQEMAEQFASGHS